MLEKANNEALGQRGKAGKRKKWELKKKYIFRTYREDHYKTSKVQTVGKSNMIKDFVRKTREESLNRNIRVSNTEYDEAP